MTLAGAGGDGHMRVRHGRATVTMRELRIATAGRWLATLVLARPHIEPMTIRVGLKSVGLAEDPGAQQPAQRVPLARAWERISERMRSRRGSV